MHATAITLNGPKDLDVTELALNAPKAGEIVVKVAQSGISTGTEKLFWTGEMPPFPGMGYPLVPGYEAAGEVVEAGPETQFKPGDRVFVPGANCYKDAYGLFGGASSLLVSDAARAIEIDHTGPEGALLALAATARHALAGLQNTPPDLIVGHGVLGRLLARLSCLCGTPPPTVWEIDPGRRAGAEGYEVISPEDDPRRDYQNIYDVSGSAAILPDLIGRIAKGGEIVLAGFYKDPINFAFPPAFMKEARLRVSAEWNRDDLLATRDLVSSGALSLDGLITHKAKAADAAQAYKTAFTDTDCLKMILDWEGHA